MTQEYEYEYGFDTFEEELMSKIRVYLPDQMKDADISIQTIRKNNGILLKSLVIREQGSNIAPNIYLEKFYKQYNDGISIECILRDIVNLRMSKEAEVPLNIETSFLTDFDQCRDRIMPRLIGTENNENLLEERPYVPVADLAVTFCIDMGDIKGGNASIPIHNGLAMSWGMKPEDLYQIALGNLEKTEVVFKTMYDVLYDMVPNDIREIFTEEELAQWNDNNMMYVLTNKQMLQGASMILNHTAMERIVEKMGDNIIVLPSSVHEVLLLPDCGKMSKFDLQCMVREVNTTQVQRDELLSNSVYRYTLQNGLVEMENEQAAQVGGE